MSFSTPTPHHFHGAVSSQRIKIFAIVIGLYTWMEVYVTLCVAIFCLQWFFISIFSWVCIYLIVFDVLAEFSRRKGNATVERALSWGAVYYKHFTVFPVTLFLNDLLGHRTQFIRWWRCYYSYTHAVFLSFSLSLSHIYNQLPYELCDITTLLLVLATDYWFALLLQCIYWTYEVRLMWVTFYGSLSSILSRLLLSWFHSFHSTHTIANTPSYDDGFFSLLSLYRPEGFPHPPACHNLRNSFAHTIHNNFPVSYLTSGFFAQFLTLSLALSLILSLYLVSPYLMFTRKRNSIEGTVTLLSSLSRGK